jgi:hypothetical protein
MKMENNLITEQVFEIKWLKLSSDIDKRFSELIEELNSNGTEFSRNLKKELCEMKKRTEDEFKEVWSYMKSHLISIEHGQKMLYDPKEGLLTIALRKVEEAIKMARDAAQCTLGSKQASEKAESAAHKAEKAIDKVWKAILFPVVGSAILWFSAQFLLIGPKQDEVINELRNKIKQDAENQNRTETRMDKLYLMLEKINRR